VRDREIERERPGAWARPAVTARVRERETERNTEIVRERERA